ncbi:hypothetical protein ACVJBD_007370 [Rhizobium mongolense]
MNNRIDEYSLASSRVACSPSKRRYPTILRTIAPFLLDKCLVVLPVGAATGEFDIIAQAVFMNTLVHEDAVVVGVEAQQREGQQFAQFRQCCDQYRLVTNQQWRAFVPPVAISVNTSVCEKAPFA